MQPKSSTSFHWSYYALLLLLALIWGSSFIIIKKSLLALSPLQVAALRMGIAGLALVPLGYHRIKEIPRKTWPAVLVVGLLGSLIPAFLFAIAQTKVPSGVSSCLNALVPLYTFILGILLFSQKFEKGRLLGVILGLAGAILLILTGTALDGGSYADFALFIVFAGILYGLSANTIRSYCSDLAPLTLTLGAFATISPLSLLLLLFTDLPTLATNHPDFWTSMGAVSLLAIIGTALANLLFFRVAQRTSALFASSVTYLIPIVGVMWGLYDGEGFGIGQMAGLALTVSGVYLAGKK